MLNLTELGVNVFMRRIKASNTDTFWDNYDLIIWKKNSVGYTNTNGMFKNNAWGITERVPVNEQGLWKLPKKYVKYFK